MKRIIICADGTWDTPDQIDTDKQSAAREKHESAGEAPARDTAKPLFKGAIREPSNVVKMARAIKPVASNPAGTQQVVFYNRGVGTGLGLLDKFIGGGFGLGLSRNVLDGYQFLVNNYEEGDEIFLFGFSRGAFTVRSLAGMIQRCGLLAKMDAYYIPEAYEHYTLPVYSDTEIEEMVERVPRWLPAGMRRKRQERLRAQYKETSRVNLQNIELFRQGKGFRRRLLPTRPVTIKFIGAWDTVGALGVPLHGPLARWINRKDTFHNVQLGDRVEHARHALAIDEWREPFEATLWRPAGPLPAGHSLRQVWFAGAHSNVGGGLHADRLEDPARPGKLRSYRLENYAFRWMVEQAAEVGLECDFEHYVRFYEARPECTIRNTLTGIYLLWGKHLRPIGETEFGNEDIHPSVRERMQLGYLPDNLKKYLER
jgi:uncharacterized protein (DUF2235 family)